MRLLDPLTDGLQYDVMRADGWVHVGADSTNSHGNGRAARRRTARDVGQRQRAPGAFALLLPNHEPGA